MCVCLSVCVCGGGGGGNCTNIPLKYKHTWVPYLPLAGPAAMSQHSPRQLLSKSAQTTHSAQACKQRSLLTHICEQAHSP